MIRALVLTALLTGCSVQIPIPGSKICEADAAIGYVGQRYTQRIGGIVKKKARATYVRAIGPDTMVTQDFRANRINLALDEKNLITRIYCG